VQAGRLVVLRAREACSASGSYLGDGERQRVPAGAGSVVDDAISIACLGAVSGLTMAWLLVGGGA